MCFALIQPLGAMREKSTSLFGKTWFGKYPEGQNSETKIRSVTVKSDRNFCFQIIQTNRNQFFSELGFFSGFCLAEFWALTYSEFSCHRDFYHPFRILSTPNEILQIFTHHHEWESSLLTSSNSKLMMAVSRGNIMVTFFHLWKLYHIN